MQAALEFRPVDIVPVEYHPSPAGIWEHGAALRRLWEQYPQDFGDSKDFPDSRPDPQFLNGEGRYEELHRDEWGVLWHQLIFGVYGHPIERPLDDWANLDRFEPPPVPPISGEEFQRERAKALLHMERYYLKSGWISMFETMHALRRFEDVLMDLSDDVTEINILADKILDYQLRTIRYLLARGVDAIQFGDDFGTSSSLMISPKTWRRSFKPRYERLFKEVHNAGKAVFFHTCGKASRILEDLAELDIDAVWPQLQSYEQGELARFCRKHGIAIALHPDRGNLMTRGEPSEIAAAVEKLAEEF
ncbi:MAG: uroporphyrinogen decarboxylase family protein, partial [Bryobacteraceae bacterium]